MPPVCVTRSFRLCAIPALSRTPRRHDYNRDTGHCSRILLQCHGPDARRGGDCGLIRAKGSQRIDVSSLWCGSPRSEAMIASFRNKTRKPRPIKKVLKPEQIELCAHDKQGGFQGHWHCRLRKPAVPVAKGAALTSCVRFSSKVEEKIVDGRRSERVPSCASTIFFGFPDPRSGRVLVIARPTLRNRGRFVESPHHGEPLLAIGSTPHAMRHARLQPR